MDAPPSPQLGAALLLCTAIIYFRPDIIAHAVTDRDANEDILTP